MSKSEKMKVNVKDRVKDSDTIDLSLSELTDVPVKEIAVFRRVRILDLSNNRLVTLGKKFTTLTNLTSLDLSRNQIRYLPEDFGNLRALRDLGLYSNNIEHLPLSFGNLTNLRYLDLKNNPLIPALVKVVGHCLTAKDCNLAARNTVRCMAEMQMEMIKAKEKLQLESVKQIIETEILTKDQIVQKSKKKSKKFKNKSKKAKVDQALLPTPVKSKATDLNILPACSEAKRKTSTALRTIFAFILLLAVNILIIYILMFKKPELIDKLFDLIPHQYRDWIVTKSKYFHVCISDWIKIIRTPVD